MRGRATGRLCVVIRGVVSDAVPCLHNGVICDLPFNVVGLLPRWSRYFAMAARLAKNAMPNFMMSVMPSATSDAA